MTSARLWLALVSLCGCDGLVTGPSDLQPNGGGGPATADADTRAIPDASPPPGTDASPPPGTDASPPPGSDASSPPAPDAAPPDAGSPGDLVSQLLALTSRCTVASNGRYSTDEGAAATIDICRLNGAFFWKSDMDIDCDGQTTTQCNSSTDPAYQNQTSFTQSNGQPLNAASLPYIVVPLPSSRFDYMASGIQPGALAIVIYNGRLNYGVFGDEGPDSIIGEASYAMAQSLGIDPDPATGGVDSGVTFIVFTGTGAVVNPIESHSTAVSLGQTLAAQLLRDN